MTLGTMGITRVMRIVEEIYVPGQNSILNVQNCANLIGCQDAGNAKLTTRIELSSILL